MERQGLLIVASDVATFSDAAAEAVAVKVLLEVEM
jgi:hypothetical protein